MNELYTLQCFVYNLTYKCLYKFVIYGHNCFSFHALPFLGFPFLLCMP